MPGSVESEAKSGLRTGGRMQKIILSTSSRDCRAAALEGCEPRNPGPRPSRLASLAPQGEDESPLTIARVALYIPLARPRPGFWRLAKAVKRLRTDDGAIERGTGRAPPPAPVPGVAARRARDGPDRRPLCRRLYRQVRRDRARRFRAADRSAQCRRSMPGSSAPKPCRPSTTPRCCTSSSTFMPASSFTAAEPKP